MEEGSVVRVSLVESDNKTRSRPALLLKKVPPHHDWLLCVISGKLHNEVKGLDIIIDKEHPDFSLTHMKHPALIRVGVLFTYPEELIEGKIGEVSKETFKQIFKNLVLFISSGE